MGAGEANCIDFAFRPSAIKKRVQSGQTLVEGMLGVIGLNLNEFMGTMGAYFNLVVRKTRLPQFGHDLFQKRGLDTVIGNGASEREGLDGVQDAVCGVNPMDLCIGSAPETTRNTREILRFHN